MPEHAPPAVTATAAVMVARTLGGKPVPVVVDAEQAARYARMFTDARVACLAGQEALDRLAALDAMPGAVVDATIHEEWCAGGHGDSVPCPPAPRLCGACGRPLSAHRADGRYLDCPPGPDPAGDGGELPAHAVGVCMKAGCGHEAMLHTLEPLTLVRLHCVFLGCKCNGYLRAQEPDGDGGELEHAAWLDCGCAIDSADHKPPPVAADCVVHGQTYHISYQEAGNRGYVTRQAELRGARTGVEYAAPATAPAGGAG